LKGRKNHNLDRRSNLMTACELKNEEIVETLCSDKRTNFLLEDTTNKTALLYAINNKSKATG
jgi:ankyrin repeat protein